jgi:hypothetical protein
VHQRTLAQFSVASPDGARATVVPLTKSSTPTTSAARTNWRLLSGLLRPFRRERFFLALYADGSTLYGRAKTSATGNTLVARWYSGATPDGLTSANPAEGLLRLGEVSEETFRRAQAQSWPEVASLDDHLSEDR